MELCLDPQVGDLLDAAFGYPAVVYSSLIFVKGTEQDVHRDSPYFATSPEGFFFGVWFALEDIHPDSGPLRYYRGGHRVPADRSGSVEGYGDSVEAACRAQGLELAVLPPVQKGDVVLWHPDLPHGGSPIADPDRTRKSMVVHYKAGTAPLHGVEVFFGHEPAGPGTHDHVEHGGRWVVDQGAPWLQ
jgi:ectoine hydroxylase-related dioxygenase (phytanoyl-CoA dioxygenase family)